MADIEITVDSGTSKRLLTGGKYCDKNILVVGGGAEPEPPDDGKTRLYITVPANAMPNLPPPRNQVPLYIQQTIDRGVTIDWGDGTPTETLPGTGKVNTTHTYEQAGDYVISLDPVDGCELGFGDGSYMKGIFGMGATGYRVYPNMLSKAIIGKNVVSIGNSAFYFCQSLIKVTIPSTVTQVGNNVFANCYSLHEAELPEGIESIGDSLFYNCYSIASVKIPSSVKAIKSSGFQNCYAIPSIIIPSSVTSIGSFAFQNLYSVKEMHLMPAIPPSLSSSTSFQDIPDDCVIYVPVGSLEAYQTATNWSTYADQMQEEPA